LPAREPSDEELVAFAESLLQDVGPHLRARHGLEEAIQQHRPTWLTLYETARALKGIVTADSAVSSQLAP
jgi:truncated hemoglobin YjbI